jgi:predicted nuclease of predicted toxin-antitoxin system
MKLWIDAQLSPFIALWINDNFATLQAVSLRSMNLNFAPDKEIFDKAKSADVVIMSKDFDFVRLLRLYGPPPKLIWVTCGNTSNAAMCAILKDTLPQAMLLFEQGEMMVEISK